MNAFECDILKYLLERCFWIHYGDGEVVAYLLNATYEIVNNLGKMFDYRDSNKFWLFGRCYRIEGNFVVKSTWTHGKMSQEKIKPVDYFMEHANKKKMLFGGKRFAEQFFTSSRIAARAESPSSLVLPPCSLSFQYPELLPKLLRYGLFVNATRKNGDVGKLLTGIIGVFLNYPTEFSDHCGDFAIEYIEKIKTMGNYLLRAIESVDPSILMKSQNRNCKNIIITLEKLSQKWLLPKLKERFRGPQELQHLCRRKIRKVLYNNWMLPDSIQKLPLPELLKGYLNLEND